MSYTRHAPVLDGFYRQMAQKPATLISIIRLRLLMTRKSCLLPLKYQRTGRTDLFNEETLPRKKQQLLFRGRLWDLTAIGEEVYQVRATAVDVGGRTTVSDIHW